MNNFYYTPDNQPDLVIEDGDDTYLCRRRRVPLGKSPESEPVWQITRLRTIATASGQVTQTMFPYGRDTYEFAPDGIGEYPFTYGV